MLIVTVAALVMAASLGWFAYRLLREEQRRADARVAVLTAALEAETPTAWDSSIRPTHVGFAAPSPVPVPPTSWQASQGPAIPGLVYVDDARPAGAFRSEHEAWPPRADGTDRHAALGLRTSEEVADRDATADAARDMSSRGSGLFADVPQARRGDARGAIALVGLVLVAILAVGYVWVGRRSAAPVAPRAAEDAAAASAVVVPAAPGGVPLELLSLSHDQRDGVLVVRGLVRNPVSGSDRTSLVASVTLLDQAGGFLGGARGPLDSSRLRPGDNAGFSVELPSRKDVRRYRVTFRASDGGLVPHADRRAARP